MKFFNLLFIAFTLFFFNNTLVGQSTIYVNQNATGANDGTSWTDAYPNLQAAIDAATVNDQIWVAAGTYYPSADNPASTNNTARDVTFYINKNIKIYGGFAGSETMLGERNPTTNLTILSGDIGTVDDNSDNTLHVVYMDGTTANGNITNDCVLDGLIIEKGNANGDFPEDSGAGIFNKGEGAGSICSPTITQCTFSNNTADIFGGAIYNFGEEGNSSPSINHCTFSQNNAGSNGGAIYNSGFQGTSSPSISHCTFSQNSAATQNSGAVYNAGIGGNSSPSISHCTFSQNNTGNQGGAIYFLADNGSVKSQVVNCLFQNNGESHVGYDDGNADNQPHFINCTFTGATSYAIDIDFWDSGMTPIDFTNCIFWGNNNDILVGNAGTNDRINIQHSIVEETAFAGTNNNLHQDPLFVDAENGDFHLQAGSPAQDIGDNTAIPAGVLTDLAGNTRIFNNTVDAGAYELQAAPLAVDWLSFTAHLTIQNQVQLDWKVTHDKDNSHFEMEHSHGDSNFSFYKKIGEVDARETLENIQKYGFTHLHPQQGWNYYRIKQVDFDGKYDYSETQAVWVDEAATEVVVYPNPTAGELHIRSTVAINQITVLDALGRTVLVANEANVDLSQQVAGTYFVLVEMEDGLVHRAAVVVE